MAEHEDDDLVTTRVTRYVAPDWGSNDTTACGQTRQTPCNGLVLIIDTQTCSTDEYANISQVEIRLLPGRYILPVFGGPKVLSLCNNFSVVADDEEQMATIVADPFHVLSRSRVNGTYHLDTNKVGNDNGDTCGLNNAANLFGNAAFSFANSTNVLLKNLRFELPESALDVFFTFTNVGNFKMDGCHFPNLPTLRQAVAILNPVGNFIINNCTFQKQDHSSSPENPYESAFNTLQIQAAVYVFQTVPAPNDASVEIANSLFTIERSAMPLPWTYRSWASYIRRTQSQPM